MSGWKRFLPGDGPKKSLPKTSLPPLYSTPRPAFEPRSVLEDEQRRQEWTHQQRQKKQQERRERDRYSQYPSHSKHKDSYGSRSCSSPPPSSIFQQSRCEDPSFHPFRSTHETHLQVPSSYQTFTSSSFPSPPIEQPFTSPSMLTHPLLYFSITSLQEEDLKTLSQPTPGFQNVVMPLSMLDYWDTQRTRALKAHDTKQVQDVRTEESFSKPLELYEALNHRLDWVFYALWYWMYFAYQTCMTHASTPREWMLDVSTHEGSPMENWCQEPWVNQPFKHMIRVTSSLLEKQQNIAQFKVLCKQGRPPPIDAFIDMNVMKNRTSLSKEEMEETLIYDDQKDYVSARDSFEDGLHNLQLQIEKDGYDSDDEDGSWVGKFSLSCAWMTLIFQATSRSDLTLFFHRMKAMGSRRSSVFSICVNLWDEAFIQTLRRESERPQQVGNSSCCLYLPTTQTLGEFEPYTLVWQNKSYNCHWIPSSVLLDEAKQQGFQCKQQGNLYDELTQTQKAKQQKEECIYYVQMGTLISKNEWMTCRMMSVYQFIFTPSSQ